MTNLNNPVFAGSKHIAIMRNYSFKPGRFASLACLIFWSGFVGLGYWQLQRAGEKITLMAQRTRQLEAPPLSLTATTGLTRDDRFRRIEVTGTYDTDHPLLLDNQIHHQQAGYHVLWPLAIEGSDRHILVNHGWIPVGTDRANLPPLTRPDAVATVTGILDHFPQPGLKLPGSEIPSPGWPARLLRLEAGALQTRLGYPLLAFQLLLDENRPGTELRDWKMPDLAPEKNQGYALQWFLFAGATLFIYIRHGFKSGRATCPPENAAQS